MCLALILAVACAAVVRSEPVGPEIRVTDANRDPELPDVAISATDEFVVVWEEDGDDERHVAGRKFAADGEASGPSIPVSDSPPFAGYPSLASGPGREDFVVVWSTHGAAGTDYPGVLGRRLDASGSPVGDAFLVSIGNPDGGVYVDYQEAPEVDRATGGDFVVTWLNSVPGSTYEVFARMHQADGAPRTGDFAVTDGGYPYERSTVAIAGDGSFVVAWTEAEPLVRPFAADGSPLGPPMPVVDTGYAYNAAAVAADSSGNFVVTWQGIEAYGEPDGIHARLLDASGSPSGPRFKVNTSSSVAGRYGYRTLAAASGGPGNFLVVWAGYGDDGPGVFGRLVSPQGPVGDEFQISSPGGAYVDDGYYGVAVSGNARGRFVATWMAYKDYEYGEPVYGPQVLARRVELDSCSMPTSGCGNGVVEPGEACDDANHDDADGCSNCVTATPDYDLLARHLPELHFDVEERHLNVAVAAMPAQAGSYLVRADDSEILAPTLDDVRPSYSNGSAATEDDALVIVPTDDCDYACMSAAAEANRCHRDRVYGRVLRTAAGATWLQYWFFSLYHDYGTDGRTAHEGDWQTVQIELVGGQPSRVIATRHDDVVGCAWNQIEHSGERPRIYVSAGGHAIYFAAGTTDTGGPKRDEHRGGVTRAPILELLTDSHPAWVRWPGHWGGTDSGLESPHGPAFLADGELWEISDELEVEPCE